MDGWDGDRDVNSVSGLRWVPKLAASLADIGTHESSTYIHKCDDDDDDAIEYIYRYI
jgi:hypothetical protein